jgi:hypothetical protein
MKTPEPVGNNLLVNGAQRFNTVRVHSIRVELEGEEIAILKRVRALGFSSNAEVIRLATLAWTDHAARLLAEEQAALDSDGLNSPESTTSTQPFPVRSEMLLNVASVEQLNGPF